MFVAIRRDYFGSQRFANEILDGHLNCPVSTAYFGRYADDLGYQRALERAGPALAY